VGTDAAKGMGMTDTAAVRLSQDNVKGKVQKRDDARGRFA